ncbi:hypothetical protein NQ318_015038 [Aromia moschata]|uniref:Uncharacterized protein n=1 Tax=Aromia moschata TaxID=1265417 RepID=A0AAV8YXK8_9CUCU|nr:hypothetical protein NQ318_015038 [Aromia moschata]
MQSQQSHHQQSLGFQQQHQGSQQQMGAAWQQFFSSAQANRNANPLGRGGVSDGDLSPTTTNQLARWFSPISWSARGAESCPARRASPSTPSASRRSRGRRRRPSTTNLRTPCTWTPSRKRTDRVTPYGIVRVNDVNCNLVKKKVYFKCLKVFIRLR